MFWLTSSYHCLLCLKVEWWTSWLFDSKGQYFMGTTKIGCLSSAVRPQYVDSWIPKELYCWWYEIVFSSIGVPQIQDFKYYRQGEEIFLAVCCIWRYSGQWVHNKLWAQNPNLKRIVDSGVNSSSISINPALISCEDLHFLRFRFFSLDLSVNISLVNNGFWTSSPLCFFILSFSLFTTNQQTSELRLA